MSESPSPHRRAGDACVAALADKLASVAGGLIVALMLAQFVIVVLRYLFAFGFSWGLDLLSYLFMTASLLPLLTVVIAGHNIRVDVFQHAYTAATKARLDRFAHAFMLLPACAHAVVVSWPALVNSWQLLEASPTLDGLPGYFALKSLLWLSFAALAVAAAGLAWRPRPVDSAPSRIES